ncbi:MAG: T9SS type A sorting domain-containing protein [Gilvibacter sp.]
MRVLRILSILLLAQYSYGQTEIKMLFYNLLEFPSAPPSNRVDLLAEVFDFYSPDVFMVCELQSLSGSNAILVNALNVDGDNYEAAPFVFNTSGSNDLQQMLYFNTDTFKLLSTEIIPTPVRDINRYELLLNSVDQATNPIVFNVYVAHLKSSMGSDNVALRFEMVDRFTDHLETIDPESYVVFAGDLNFYTGAELGYLQLTASSNPVILKDPLNRSGNWHNNTDYEDLFSQSTRTSSGPFGGSGAGGGMDDRFDHIVISENFFDDTPVRYLPDSYKTIGNNGNCFNKSVNDASCSGEYSAELRNLLYNISDHLPIGISLETDLELLSGTEFVVNEMIGFPIGNVVADRLLLNLDGSLPSNTMIHIYNSLGQKITTLSTSDATQLSWDASGLSSGVYYLALQNMHSQPVKFIKQ